MRPRLPIDSLPRVTSPRAEPSIRPPFWRDVRVLRVVGQVVAVTVIFLLFRWLYVNLVANSQRVGFDLDYGLLTQPTQFHIP